MTILFIILIIIASVILSLIVLVQNPKGGGLAGTLSGISNQFMGVKQTNDILEKGTWTFAGIIAALCIISTIFIKGGEQANYNKIQSVGTGPVPTQQAPPTNQVPAQQVPPAQQPTQTP